MGLEHLVTSGRTGVDEMAGQLSVLSRLQNLRLWRCDFRDVSVLSNLFSFAGFEFWRVQQANLLQLTCNNKLQLQLR
jgi:hypothetical protein